MELNMNKKEFQDKYPIYLYGGDNFMPIVKHEGTYEPLYRIQELNIKSLITILKKVKVNFSCYLFNLLNWYSISWSSIFLKRCS